MKFIIAAWFVIEIFAALPAFAQGENCGDRQAIVDKLASKYGETRKSVGLNPNNSLTEIFVSPTTGTWTVIVSMPTGMSCLMAGGTDWQDVEPEEKVSGRPA